MLLVRDHTNSHCVTKLIKSFLHRNALFTHATQSLAPDTCGIQSLCLAGWTVSDNALKNIVEKY